MSISIRQINWYMEPMHIPCMINYVLELMELEMDLNNSMNITICINAI